MVVKTRPATNMKYGSTDSVSRCFEVRTVPAVSQRRQNGQFIDDYRNMAKRKISSADKFCLLFSCSVLVALVTVALLLYLRKLYLSQGISSFI